MKIQYASDLHLEFKENTAHLQKHPLEVKGDILVLAGDVTLFGKNKYFRNPFFDWCAENYRQTYIIPGNHEYYDGYELADTLDDFSLEVRPNVHYLNNRSVRLSDDVELFFTTLWSPIEPLQIVPVQMGMTDCYRIKYDGGGFNANDYELVYKKCLGWLTEALQKSDAKHKIVVTHHCPTKTLPDPRFPGSTVNSAFCADLDKFIEHHDIYVWIFGHTHYNGGEGEVIGDTRLHTNQLGYVRHSENGTFRHDAIIEA